MTYQILKGNSLDLLPTLADNSIDAIVTDPPYELGFMGKTWDNSGIAYSLELWQQCLRVLKPGGHLLAFSGSRTYHRMVVSIEDAGFEIRDMISWISNKTFPKSLNIGKAIDKAAGAERKVLRWESRPFKINNGPSDSEYNQIHSNTMDSDGYGTTPITEPATDEAKKWDGWGTGLKPTVEPIVMARKPVEGTVANNVLTYGTGGLNIDASRIGTEERTHNWAGRSSALTQERTDAAAGMFAGNGDGSTTVAGRWPANLILDEQAAELLDEQSGQTKGVARKGYPGGSTFGGSEMKAETGEWYGDSGGASRFFYVAKASKRDRNEGLEDLEESVVGSYAGNVANKGNKIGAEPEKPNQPAKNFHPTVKPTELMRYLVKLITPLGGTVLDPFTGSGSTGKAAILEGFDFIGIELTEDYWPIIEGRLKHAEAKVVEAKENIQAQPQGLF
jgi:site-specific DNA-methyltransferase (adenine-specific)